MQLNVNTRGTDVNLQNVKSIYRKVANAIKVRTNKSHRDNEVTVPGYC